MNNNPARISGSGHFGGGEYSDIHVSGSGRFEGDIKVDDTIKTSGSAHFSGNVETNELSSSGNARIEGNLTCREELRTSGTVRIGGDVKAHLLRSSGSCRINGNLSGSITEVSGSCSVEGCVSMQKVNVSGTMSCKEFEAEQLRLIGSLAVEAFLNAGEMLINRHSSCCAKEIGCETLTVTEGFGLNLLRFFGKRTIRANVIEGDTLHLISVEADVVRGKDIFVGEDCRIGLVEYSGTLTVRGGQIENEVKLETE